MKQAIVAAALIEQDRKILLAKRSGGKRTAPNLYHLPGGHVEFGEQPAEALRRELAEELGAGSEVGAPFAAFAYMEDGGVHTVAIVYSAKLLGQPELRTEENASLVWISPEDCAAYFAAGDPVLAAIRGCPGMANLDSC